MCYDSVTVHKEDTTLLNSLIIPQRFYRWVKKSAMESLPSMVHLPLTSSHLLCPLEIKGILYEAIINTICCLFQLVCVPEHQNVLKADAVRNMIFKLVEYLESSAFTQGA